MIPGWLRERLEGAGDGRGADKGFEAHRRPREQAVCGSGGADAKGDGNGFVNCNQQSINWAYTKVVHRTLLETSRKKALMSIYDFTVKDQQGNAVSLADYRGRVLLIVNTATECGFTPTYAQLEELYRALRERGLDVLDFPCDQFGHQAPGTNEEIAAFCTSRFGVTFPQFAKIEINGEGADPLFAYLQEQKGFEGFDQGHELTPVLEDLLAKADPGYAQKPSIKWNFTKFLVDRDGNVVRRFEPTASIPDAVAPAVEELL